MRFLGRSIVFLSVLLLCAIGYVWLSLMLRSPARAGTPARPTVVLEPKPDGSLYSVNLELEKFERRLMEEEKRSEKLQTDLDAMRQSRDDLADQVDALQDDVKRLRRQLNDTQKPPVKPQPANTPGNSPSVIPGSGTSVPGPDTGVPPVR